MAEMQSGAAPMLLAARPRKDVLSRDGSIPKRRGGNMVSRILSVPETGKKKWCGLVAASNTWNPSCVAQGAK
jgi:hypothetical protein